MTYAEVEEMFNRALRYSFSRVKFLFIFSVLLICGVLVVFCRAMAFQANTWVVMSLSFLPVFLCTGVLLAAGVLLTRIYYHEIKGLSFGFKKLFSQSFQMLIGVSYLSLPLILVYLMLWTLMGVFHLLKGLPAVGPVMGVLLSFGPFLLVFASLVLTIASLLILFFVTPHVALKTRVDLDIAEEVFDRIRMSVFSNALLLMIALTPMSVIISLLTIAAMVTGANFVPSDAALGVSLGWFFIMVPFCLILTPFITFFFNFAMESFGLLQRNKKARIRKVEKEENTCA